LPDFSGLFDVSKQRREKDVFNQLLFRAFIYDESTVHESVKQYSKSMIWVLISDIDEDQQ